MRTEAEIKKRLEERQRIAAEAATRFMREMASLLPVLSYQDSRQFLVLAPNTERTLSEVEWEKRRRLRLSNPDFANYIREALLYEGEELPREQLAILLTTLVWLVEDEETFSAMERVETTAMKIAIARRKYGA